MSEKQGIPRLMIDSLIMSGVAENADDMAVAAATAVYLAFFERGFGINARKA